MGHKRTNAVQQRMQLFDHLTGKYVKLQRNGEVKGISIHRPNRRARIAERSL
jgi:hypothetical protein